MDQAPSQPPAEPGTKGWPLKTQRLVFAIGYPLAVALAVFLFVVLAPVLTNLFQDQSFEPCEDPAISFLVHCALTVPISFGLAVAVVWLTLRSWRLAVMPVVIPMILTAPVELMHAAQCAYHNASPWDLFSFKMTITVIWTWVPILALLVYFRGLWLLFRQPRPI